MAGTHLKYAFTMPCTQLLDSKISGRILKAAREQQQEIDAEDFEDEREQTRAKVRWQLALGSSMLAACRHAGLYSCMCERM